MQNYFDSIQDSLSFSRKKRSLSLNSHQMRYSPYQMLYHIKQIDKFHFQDLIFRFANSKSGMSIPVIAQLEE